jgi:hypothetical protein
MPDAIVVSHWTLRNGVPHLETNKRLTRIVDVRLTPDLSPSNPKYCGKFRGQSPDPNNIILPGTCIGTWYNETGKPDIKNGRYLYWVDNNGNRHCVINRKQRIPDIVVYYHYNIQQNPTTGFVSLKPEVTYKYGVIDVFRTRLT